MANESVSISGPIKVTSDAKERVAYELMNIISHCEGGKKDREYYLRLYCQCWKATNGKSVESVLLESQNVEK
jgi:hypothetical protein